MLRDNFTDPFPDIPGDLKLPFVGSTFGLIGDMHGALRHVHETYGEVFKLRAFGKNVIGLLGPEANQLVLHDKQDDFLNKPGWEWILGDLFPGAIMLSDGEEHKRYRRIMQTAFHRQPMTGYLRPIESTVMEYLDEYLPVRDGRLLTYPAMVELVMSIAGRLFFGLEFDRRNLDAITSVTLASMAPLHFPLPFTAYRRGIRGRRRLTEYYRDRIAERRDNPGDDLFSQLCIARSEEGEVFSDQEIIDQMIFVMMASHDTTTSTLTSLIYETARHPEWQDRMAAEADAFYAAGPLEYERLKEFDVIGRVINETLRLHPALMIMPRYAARDFEFRGHHIPAGTMVAVSPYATHFMPAIFPDPERFDPDRFLPERAEHKQHPFCFIPFGAGRHICIGKYFAEMEMRIVMAHFARRFRWSVPEGYSVKYGLPLNHPEDGLPVFIQADRR